MSRSGYSDGCDRDGINYLYRGVVASAARGRRGQAFLRDLIEALDALPEKRLISGELIQDGEVCAIGALGVKRGVDMSVLDPEDASTVGLVFNIAEQLAREVVWENDEAGPYHGETPKQRWIRMRSWAEALIKTAKPVGLRGVT